MAENRTQINQSYLDNKNKNLEESIKTTLNLDFDMDTKLDVILDSIATALEETYSQAFTAGIKSVNQRKMRAAEASSLGR